MAAPVVVTIHDRATFLPREYMICHAGKGSDEDLIAGTAQYVNVVPRPAKRPVENVNKGFALMNDIFALKSYNKHSLYIFVC